MHGSQFLFVLLLLHLGLLFLVPFASCQNSMYEACTPSDCGEIRISYPFKFDGKPDYCGEPGFMMFCEDGEPILQLQSDNYTIRHIDYHNHILSVVNRDFEANPCPFPDHNVTLESSPYNFTFQVGYLSFFYCSEQISNASFSQIPCLSNQSSFAFFTQLYGLQDIPISRSCRAPVVVPIMESALQGLSSGELNFSSALQQGFSLNWMEEKCSECVMSGGRCGYNTSRLGFRCFCYDGDYPAICGVDFSGKPKVWLKFIIGIGAIGMIILAGLFLAATRWKSQLINIILVWKKPESGRDFEKILKNYGTQMPKRYSYSDVKKMTKFLKIKLGEGGYGSVFKGQLIDGRLVAVKILSDSKGKGEDFINEVATIGRTAHVNIVRLVGFCLEGLRRALVYEFMPNGSLEKFNFSKDKEQNLGWETLFKIALGIARGLEYLHRGCNMRILHFDIKPHNILLDQDFCPKISDFGLAKLCSGKNSIVSMTAARGTVGYIAPELIYRSLGGVSHKSDVYSYGMLLLEMVGVRKNTEAPIENNSEIYFPDWIYNRIENRRNLQLSDYIEGIEGEVARKLIIVGLWCIQTKPINRPSMSKVVEMLEGNLEDLHIPPKPILSSFMEVEYAAPTNIETSDSLS